MQTDELFPGHDRALAQTDPELVEYFDNFAFGEVVSATREPSTGCVLSTRARPRPESHLGGGAQP